MKAELSDENTKVIAEEISILKYKVDNVFRKMYDDNSLKDSSILLIAGEAAIKNISHIEVSFDEEAKNLLNDICDPIATAISAILKNGENEEEIELLFAVSEITTYAMAVFNLFITDRTDEICKITIKHIQDIGKLISDTSPKTNILRYIDMIGAEVDRNDVVPTDGTYKLSSAILSSVFQNQKKILGDSAPADHKMAVLEYIAPYIAMGAIVEPFGIGRCECELCVKARMQDEKTSDYEKKASAIADDLLKKMSNSKGKMTPVFLSKKQ